MGVPLETFMQKFTADERVEIDAHAKRLIAEEMSLRDLRKAMGKTQAQLARKLNKPQASVSRIEKQSDMLISTLDRVVHALGGRVRILAELPGRPPLLLTGLADLAPEEARPNKQAHRGRSAPRKRDAGDTSRR
jgi:transcriptional regulator with XRE-family HTH domain